MFPTSAIAHQRGLPLRLRLELSTYGSHHRWRQRPLGSPFPLPWEPASFLPSSAILVLRGRRGAALGPSLLRKRQKGVIEALAPKTQRAGGTWHNAYAGYVSTSLILSNPDPKLKVGR